MCLYFLGRGMKKIVITTVAMMAITLGIVWITQEKTSQAAQLEKMQPTAGSVSESAPVQPPGGAFTLTDQNGEKVKDSDFRGRLMLVYFGFTACPDMCPLAVTNLSKAMDVLGNKADQVAPLFISIDPEHDSPAALKDFLSSFNKHFVGLTGTPDEIAHVAGEYKTYYAKPVPPVSGDKMAMPGAIDHSGFIYVMGKDGAFITALPPEAKAQDIAEALKPYLNE
jgi:cytochrome oxidase Cu insertion factor (SCO1/SenC/PrrC family)